MNPNLYARPHGKDCVELEYGLRADGKLNLWKRTMGKYWWKAWRLIAVLKAKDTK